MSIVAVDTITDAAGGNTASINGIPLRQGVLDPENRIINGAFDFWQRGTSFSAIQYGADRWLNVALGGSVNMSRQEFAAGDTFGSNNPTYFLRQTVSGQSAAGNGANFQQAIEDVRSYAGQTVTVLGWARRSSGSGNMAIEGVQYFGTGGTPSVGVDGINPAIVSLTTSWQPFAVTITFPSITGKTIGTNNNSFSKIRLWTSAGSDFNAMTNSLGIQTIGVDFWGIHIKLGVHTTDATALYKQPELGPELAQCQRYYCRTFFNVRATSLGSGSYYENAIYWPQQMRGTPTTTLDTTGAFQCNPTIESPSPFGARATIGATASGDARLLLGAVTADAEL